MIRYIALIEEDNGNYGVVFPDLPGIVSAGSSFDDAVKNAHEILAYAANTQTLPSPRSLEAIKANWEDWQEWQSDYNFVITSIQVLPISTKAKRINIMIDETLLARLDTITSNRSEFIGKALETMMG
jgi:predicted RNase H-like HicB family nuclease